MKTVYYTSSSLDGYIAAPDNSLAWLLQFDQMEVSEYPEFIRNIGALAMGSTTYEWLLAHIDPDSDQSEPWPYEQPAWVFSSRTLPMVSGVEVRFVHGDVRPVHQEMVAAAGGKDIWIVGGGDLAGQFYDQGLLDELIVGIAPVTLGGGAPLLPRAIVEPRLRLLSTKQFGDTFVELTYAVPRPARSE